MRQLAREITIILAVAAFMQFGVFVNSRVQASDSFYEVAVKILKAQEKILAEEQKQTRILERLYNK